MKRVREYDSQNAMTKTKMRKLVRVNQCIIIIIIFKNKWLKNKAICKILISMAWKHYFIMQVYETKLIMLVLVINNVC